MNLFTNLLLFTPFHFLCNLELINLQGLLNTYVLCPLSWKALISLIFFQLRKIYSNTLCFSPSMLYCRTSVNGMLAVLDMSIFFAHTIRMQHFCTQTKYSSFFIHRLIIILLINFLIMNIQLFHFQLPLFVMEISHQIILRKVPLNFLHVFFLLSDGSCSPFLTCGMELF